MTCTTSRSGHAACGFTLLELLMVMAVIAIVLLGAWPSFANHTARVRVEQRAAQLSASLHTAALAAIKHGQPVAVRAVGDRFQRGWVVFADANGNRRIDAGERVYQRVAAADASDVAMTASAPAVTFGPNGGLADKTAFVITVCGAPIDGVASAHRVAVAPTGSIRDRPLVAAAC